MMAMLNKVLLFLQWIGKYHDKCSHAGDKHDNDEEEEDDDDDDDHDPGDDDDGEDDDDDNDDNDDDDDDDDHHDHDDGTLLAGRWIQWSGPYTPPRPALTMSVDDGDWGWWW